MEKFIKTIAKEAGKISLKYFNKSHNTSKTKAHALDLVTKGDLAVNKYLVRAIQSTYSMHGIISEETGTYQENAEYVWVVDPIDGTINFAKGIPLYGVIIALLHNGRVEMGVLYDPVHDDLYFAKKKKGAFLNNKKIQCTKQKTLANSFGDYGNRLHSERFEIAKKIADLANNERVQCRSLFSVAVSSWLIARGREDWMYSKGGHIWDYAAPSLILSEAGCKVTNFKGDLWKLTDREIVAANPALHKILIQAFT